MKLWLSFAVLVLLVACSSKPKEAADDAAAAPVEVTPAEMKDLHVLVTAEAVLYPVNQATIVPKITAPVRQFLAQRGDHVKQGQLLAVLEDRDLRASAIESQQLYQQAEANLENTRSSQMPDDLTKAKSDLTAAQETLDAAQKVYDNRVGLFKEGAIAQKLVDDAKVSLVQAQSQLDTAKQHLASIQNAGQPAQLKSAEAQANAAKAHYESSAAQTSYSEVRSPISGIVADRGINLGDIAGNGTPLFTIVDISRVVARANIPMGQLARLHAGQAATIRTALGTWKGKVTVISPSADANTTTAQVWVEVPNTNESLRPGESVKIEIEAGDVHAIAVPASAILASDEGGEKVMVALADGTAQERKVEVGIRDGDNVQVVSGLKAGENVITKGALGLDDKAKIEVAKPGADKAGDDK